jgi:uncharacterized membrane protein SpoIIM required for sporulation
MALMEVEKSPANFSMNQSEIEEKETEQDETSPRRPSAGVFSSLFSARTFWGILLGALVSIILCVMVSLTGSLLGLYSRGLTVAWPLHAETATQRGALIGFLIGWLAHTRQEMIAVFIVAAVGLLVGDWKAMEQAFVHSRNRIDAMVTIHYLLYALAVCVSTHSLLERQGKNKKSG